MGLYYNGHKVRNLYYNGKCITRLALGKEMTRLVEGDDFVRAQWLVANIPIGVAMMSLPINSSTFNCTIEHTGAQANLPHLYSNGYMYFTDSSNMDMIAVWNVSEKNIPFSASVGSLMIIESNEEYFKVNNISIIKYGFPITILVIQSSYNSNNATTTKTSKISVDGIERYIPVKLLRPIPATLDANGIARNAGECGMYDAVSGKFFGNVANSGTFTVEPSLVEGVDYERHKWLVGDGSAYIEGINYNLWDNTISLQIGKTNVRGNKYLGYNYISITEDMSASPSYLMVIFRQNSDSTPHIADIDPYSSMPDVVTMNFYIENSLFYCNQNGIVKTNSPAQTAIESTWKSVTPLIYSMKMSYIREVLSNGTYRSNLIPVRLLRPLPSYLDANGKARHQFECGMLDLKTKKFYGNVNTSGNFTVSDN